MAVLDPNEIFFTAFEPKVKNRFIMYVDGIPSYVVTINILGPVGDIVSEWIIKGAFIKTANFGDYSYDEDAAAQEITVTLGMDYCILNF